MRIGTVEVGPGHPCRTVAEIGNAHNGDLERALRLINAAKEAGADFVKFQCYLPEELIALRGDGAAPEPWGSQGWTMRKLYEKAQTPHDWFPVLVDHCDHLGMPWFSSVFGEESLALLQSLDCPAYKVARLDNLDRALRKLVHSVGAPVLVSHSDSQSMRAGTSGLNLWCPEGYPQPRFDLRAAFERDPDYGRDYDGFSYHGTDPFVLVVAATLGASLVEVHFQLDDEPSELEANVSLTATQFRDMVEGIRRAEEVLGA